MPNHQEQSGRRSKVRVEDSHSEDTDNNESSCSEYRPYDEFDKFHEW